MSHSLKPASFSAETPPSLLRSFRAVRDHTEFLAAALMPEDQTIQSMPDASPAKWHRAHTTWFFEQFVLLPRDGGRYRPYDEAFSFLFNSYYEALGARYPRATRGLVTRPGVEEVGRYRAHVDRGMAALIEGDADADGSLDTLVTLGLHHEQQHQELLVTDMLHAFAQNPLAWRGDGLPVIPGWRLPAPEPGEARFLQRPGGLAMIGHDGQGFGFDNEFPRHQALLQPHALSDRLVRNADWLRFMADGGYRTASLWMSDGWATATREEWDAPLHWRPDGAGGWLTVTPGGLGAVDPEQPVRHVSWYEADAFARWAGARLPTEHELEAAASELPDFHGHVWQWTNSAYLPYPGFRAVPGAIGEYNGKFMINQMVLRGSSSATPPGHARRSYRNFFQPEKRWQCTGLRLARDI
ncbi:ergothioneine biosynthesis protein EgtB [Rhizosaccharibacter radicis]|uniref:Ergothioneine biosynthesis protein EgtB n=1 Tax=Rhizosaccharibacter radicis TaxID=2782605 RepID=A0ABT1VZ50_9PROT|nr:ergothioneine biosynthesis protein EgtB [Acetobacteraceae bacterium KSS12]